MSTKICEICGQEKPAEAFSKSYRNRCRDCVAEQTRNARQAKQTKPEPEPDPAAVIPEATAPDWEARHYALALSLFGKFVGDNYLNGIGSEGFKEMARMAKQGADEFITIMRGQEECPGR